VITMKKIIAVALFLVMVQNANATIIDSGTYLTDTDTGLDWLDVTASQGRTYKDVSNQFGTGGDFEGWEYATGNQFNTLVSNYVGLATPIATTEKFIHAEGAIDGLVSLLGSTLDKVYLDLYGVTYDEKKGYVEGEGLDYTAGIIIDTFYVGPVSKAYQVAMIWDYDIGLLTSDYTKTYNSNIPDYAYNAGWGSYLVRATSMVPTPATLPLLALGLLGLLIRRRCSTSSLLSKLSQ